MTLQLNITAQYLSLFSEYSVKSEGRFGAACNKFRVAEKQERSPTDATT